MPNIAAPECYIEIYPFEGGAFSIQGGQILSCTVTKAIRTSEGSFEIMLAPGGPRGPNLPPTWTDVITPISFTLIGMARGQYRQIVMIGVVTNITESQEWMNNNVRRVILIRGQDFTYFFNTFNYVVLAFLGSTTTAIGQELGGVNLGFPSILSGHYLDGPPDEVGKNWYQTVMDGSSGILTRTVLNYRNNRLSFSDVMGVLFQKFPNFSIPLGDLYIPAQGTWLEKFRAIFEWPWYEFFITTAPFNFYPDPPGSGWTVVSKGTAFTMPSIGPRFPASPVAIARVNPLPHIDMQESGNTFSFGGINKGDWDFLNAGVPFTFDTAPGFIESNISFSEDEVRNFYMLNPTWTLSMLGLSNSSISPAVFTFQMADDPASIHRYGYRPAIHETHWFDDVPPGNTAQKNAGNVGLAQTTYGELLSKLFSYYEPTSLMMRGLVKGILRPDIMAGCTFEYLPFKNEGPWKFYIDGFSHRFEFGGPSTTTLFLSRGLPSVIYADSSSNGLLKNIHLGNAMRINGDYRVGLPPEPGGVAAQGLQMINLANTSAEQVLSDIARVFQTAQRR